jgi:trehalose 6-phosphate phosphatase
MLRVSALLASGDVTSSNDVTADLVRAVRDDAARAALLFDIDGVLAPIVPNAGDACVPDEVRGLLGTLRDRYLLVGLVSGRGLADVDRMVPVAGLARGGNHGLEVAPPGRPAELVPVARPHMGAMRAFVDAHPPAALTPHGVWLEDKGASVSLHFREAPDPVAAEDWLRREVDPAARLGGLRVRHGRMVLEVLPDVDVDKGTVVRQMIGASGARIALYVGDDRTDVNAWRALRAMAATGELDAAWCVLADHPEVGAEVRDGADLAVAGTAGVLHLLHALAE